MRLGMAETAFPRQALATEPLTHGHQRRHTGLQYKTQLLLGPTTVEPVHIGVFVVQQQPRGEQGAEQGAVMDQGFQGLLQVLCLLQGVAGRAVMPRPQALAKQKTAVIGFE